jgi:hypothetical protein
MREFLREDGIIAERRSHCASREKLRPYLVRLDVEGPVLATALGKIPIQVVAKPLRDFGLGSHEIPDAVIFGG